MRCNILSTRNHRYWDLNWKETTVSPTFTREIACYETRSVLWEKAESRILKLFGSFEGLEAVELGSGIGTMSLIMALRGCNVTLVDYSEYALKRARQLFDCFGIDARLVRADALCLSDDFHSSFDISMSFGLAEHSAGVERQKVIDVHFDLLREGGIVFISVPNALSIPYRMRMFLWKLRSKHRGGLLPTEVPFTKAELTRRVIGKAKYCEVFGCSFMSSIISWILAPQLRSFYRLAKHAGSTPSAFDDYLSSRIVLFGVK